MARPVIWPTNPRFYPFGDTPPVSLLRDVPPEVDADVLLLGCGDPRNILYTIHESHLGDPSATRKIDFTCCDNEPAILARNIVFLTLLLRDDYDKIRPCIWNIFYHFFIDDISLKTMIEQCKTLARLSKNFDTWNSCQYAGFIEIGTRFTLEELHKHWEWYAAAETWSSSKKRDLKKILRSAMRAQEKSLRGFVVGAPARSAGPMWPNAALVANEAYHRYWETGLAKTDTQHSAATEGPLDAHVNPLFAYAHGQEGFFAHRDTCPVVPFLLAEYFNPLGADRASRPSTGALNTLARVQLFKWCSAFRSCIQHSNRITLRLVVGDASGNTAQLCRSAISSQRR